MLTAFALAASLAPQPLAGAAAWRQACLDAGTDAVVLNVAAHPDDESARTMVFFRRRHGLRTVTLYTTCGEGGQNAVGREIGRALARRRVLETLAAAEHTGTEVRWLGFEDFGYSKTLAETLQRWGEAKLVAAMLDQLRQVRPDLVLTNHSVGSGHGHHRASAWAIGVALGRWQQEIGRGVPLYERVFDAEAEAPVEIDPAQLDPVTGETYARLAHRGWVEHASQGPWRPHDPFAVRGERWRPLGPATFALEALDDLPSMFTSPAVSSVLGDAAPALRARLAALRQDRSRREALESVQRTLRVLRDLRERLPPETVADWGRIRVDRRLEALERLWLAGHDVTVEATLQRDSLPAAAEAVLRVAVHAGDPQQVANLDVSLRGQRGAPPEGQVHRPNQRELRFHWSPDAPIDPLVDPAAAAEQVRPDVRFELEGTPVVIRPAVRVTRTPLVELHWGRDVLLCNSRSRVGREIVVPLSLAYHGDGSEAAPLELTAPAGIHATVLPRPPALSADHREARVLVRLQLADPAALAPAGELVAAVGADRAVLPVATVDVVVPEHRRVGLVRGPDDSLQRALADLGIDYIELDEDRLAVADLDSFTTLVLDMRTRQHREDLLDHRDRILEFCQRGGRVVVFYHKPGEWNARAGRPVLAPFALEVGNDRVAEEDAPVTILQPGHPLLSTPHRIGAADFAGWVQERGLNFPAKWAAEWTPLLRMNDRGEQPHDGALLVAPYGEGRYVYCSLALYRQWRLGHQGALRLLVNML